MSHADAVVVDGEGFGLGVGGDFDLRLLFGFEDGGLGEAQVAQLFQGVGGVGHQLADEDLAVGVEGIDDDVQQLADFGLEGLVGGRSVGLVGAHVAVQREFCPGEGAEKGALS